MTFDLQRYMKAQSDRTEEQLDHFDFENADTNDELAFLRQRWQQIRQRISPLVPGNAEILEIGCREGFGLAYLRDVGGFQNVHGIDVCERAIEMAKEKNIDCRHGDMHALPWENKFFDFVIAYEVIEHSYNVNLLLQEIHRVTKDEGFLIAQVPIETSDRWHAEDHSMLSGHASFFIAPPLFHHYINQAYDILDSWDRYCYIEKLHGRVIVAGSGVIARKCQEASFSLALGDDVNFLRSLKGPLNVSM